MVDCLCDAGYVGQTLNKYCETKNYHLIVKPRNKLRKTHVISEIDADHLKKFRNRIELLNQNIRRYRALMIKWVSIYQCFLFPALQSNRTYKNHNFSEDLYVQLFLFIQSYNNIFLPT